MNMEQNVTQKNMWNMAGKAGLVLGLISTAYLFITQGLGQIEIPALVNSILGFVLWTAKFPFAYANRAFRIYGLNFDSIMTCSPVNGCTNSILLAHRRWYA